MAHGTWCNDRRPGGRRLRGVFELLSHTADLRVRIEAATIEELFRDALRALMTCAKARPDLDSTTIYRQIAVTAVDRTALLVDFLNEALALSIVEREQYVDVRFRVLGSTELVATLVGARAAFGAEIKAVTYHEADVVQSGDDRWTTVLVFDI
jgi:SHS2 domain-containing protein